METKDIKGWLILDYKTGSMRTAKKLKGTRSVMKATEIPIEIYIKVEVPDKPILKAEGEIKLSSTQVSKMIIESLKEENNLEDEQVR